jgi:hypothetical protein
MRERDDLVDLKIDLSGEKCARQGCRGLRQLGGIFCLACEVTGKAGPDVTCDNLPAIVDVRN